MMSQLASARLTDTHDGRLVANAWAPHHGPATLWHTGESDDKSAGLYIPPFKVNHSEALEAWVIVVAAHILVHEQGDYGTDALEDAARAITAAPLDDMYIGSRLLRPAAAIPHMPHGLADAFQVLGGLEYRLEASSTNGHFPSPAFAELGAKFNVWVEKAD